eukprot:TRINITY_DN8025_c0_g2_i5.p1 TRINITY_DN8025_c0_g2~~TRINITY_DN8025_c0_g2_i5.p1  ORF type:complete len:308 (+),score=73.54 TRINITY_DN8025_c0_g2_i5:121-1044(+)
MDGTSETSRITLRFGPDFKEDEAQINCSVEAIMSDKLAKQFVKDFMLSTKNHVKPHYNIIVKFWVRPDKQKDFEECLRSIFEGLEDSTPLGYLRGRIKQKVMTAESYTTGDYVYLIIGFKEDYFQELRTTVMNVLEMGLGDIAFNQETILKLSFKSKNDFSDILTMRREDNSLSSCLFRSLKIGLSLTNNKDLLPRLIEVLGNVENSLKNHPSLKMLTFFHTFDAEFEFESSDKFTQVMSRHFGLAFIEKLERLTISSKDRKLLLELTSMIENGLNIYACIPNLLQVEAVLSGPGFKRYLDAYFLLK